MARDAGYDDFLDALADGTGYYLACENDHGSLPPRRVCPRCGGDLREEPLPETGDVASYTEVHVATPSFVDDAPYVTAVVDFGPVNLTGILRGVDADDVETGMTVTVGVDGGASAEGEAGGDGGETGDAETERSVVFEPR
ncbi:Zn-ribbon domain-containing OB-fold protein [Halocalculus aciditolerans]|uniref:ChsH2 C-terminal OB-fold domain-containing protein n=1 Tax=Halocalculus aciditolerans TaxID=1383812 RepID=A0A830F3M4_9EURY|nr:OB-fold domain-containing protein [Halocalculus aciditolerans]GGL59977.1 hypothetical protein GCM10009039_17780 [Halocalculus aciditolerans]